MTITRRFLLAGVPGGVREVSGPVHGNVGARLDGNTRGEHGHAHAATDAITVIDAGIRQWYKSCRCWPSDAHPEVVKIRDAEKATPTVGA